MERSASRRRQPRPYAEILLIPVAVALTHLGPPVSLSSGVWLALAASAVCLAAYPLLRRVARGRRSEPIGAEPVPRLARDPIALLLDVLGDLGLGVVLTDAAGTVQRTNALAVELVGCDGRAPTAAVHPRGLFFGLPVEDTGRMASFASFFAEEADREDGEVTLAVSRRRICWSGRVLCGSEGFGDGRLFVLRDVTEERRFEILKSDFLAMVSHELRTPLTALRGSLQLVLSRGDGLPHSERQLIAIGVKNTERLIRLVNDLLDVDRLEQGTLAFHFEALAVANLVADAVRATAEALEGAQLRIVTHLSEGLPPVHGDRQRLVQVLTNLLDNARKYAPAGSEVSVRAVAVEGGVQIDVRDGGPGIPLSEQPHVFERFWRADQGGPQGGAGLGLAICRAIVARHAGRIWIESEEGAGTTVSVFLPLSIFRPQPAEEAAPPDRARILIVEDEPDARAVLHAALVEAGYEVCEATTGGEAVKVARGERPAAVLLDLVLPDISGYDVLRILRNSPETAALPVVVLSIEPERDLARRLGAWEALEKPVDMEAVRGCLGAAIRAGCRADGRLVLGVGPTVSPDLSELASVLQKDAHEVYRAEDLEDLGRWSAVHYPDVLVLDSDFIGHTCAEAAATLQGTMAGRRVPVVFVGSRAEPRAGDGNWIQLAKPVCKDEVLEAAGALLGSGRK